eukprot:TRINITY_DN679_c0_g1_i1.p1 TRINITY_DN679_c0_g1~~TRINITY_DN679_c0_g1_i1.p1  ORF type:complete len:491 (+),score=68.86 TRINITY_DN679_c0_g1_i1:61-1533(+)
MAYFASSPAYFGAAPPTLDAAGYPVYTTAPSTGSSNHSPYVFATPSSGALFTGAANSRGSSYLPAGGNSFVQQQQQQQQQDPISVDSGRRFSAVPNWRPQRAPPPAQRGNNTSWTSQAPAGAVYSAPRETTAPAAPTPPAQPLAPEPQPPAPVPDVPRSGSGLVPSLINLPAPNGAEPHALATPLPSMASPTSGEIDFKLMSGRSVASFTTATTTDLQFQLDEQRAEILRLREELERTREELRSGAQAHAAETAKLLRRLEAEATLKIELETVKRENAQLRAQLEEQRRSVLDAQTRPRVDPSAAAETVRAPQHRDTETKLLADSPAAHHRSPPHSVHTVSPHRRPHDEDLKPYIGLEVRETEVVKTGQVRVKVTAVTPNGPAHHARIQVGDIITKWDNQPVTSKAEFAGKVETTPVGAEILVHVERKNQISGVDERHFFRVHIHARPAKTRSRASPKVGEAALVPVAHARRPSPDARFGGLREHETVPS